MRKIKAIILALCVGASSLALSDKAGAVSVDCPGSPTNNGWFDARNPYNSRHGSVKCTIDGNHIAVNMTAIYGGNSYTALGAVDIWFPWYCQVVGSSFTNSAGAYSPFYIFLHPTSPSYGCGQNDLIYYVNGSYQQSWESGIGNYYRQFRAGGANNLWADSGAGSTVLDSGGWNNTLPFVQMRVSAVGTPNMSKLVTAIAIFPGA